MFSTPTTVPVFGVLHLPLVLFVALACFHYVVYASHSVTLLNFCGTGTPVLNRNSIVLSTGNGTVYVNGTVQARAFLNTTGCTSNGGNCTQFRLSLGLESNDLSSVVIDLIPAASFSVPVSFFYSGCDGSGQSCLDPDCIDAERSTTTQGLVCTETGASVVVNFCPESSTSISAIPSVSASSTSAVVSASSTSGPAISSSTKRSTIGLVVGAVVGGVAILLLLVLLLIYQPCRSRAQKAIQIEPYIELESLQDPGASVGDAKPVLKTIQQPSRRDSSKQSSGLRLGETLSSDSIGIEPAASTQMQQPILQTQTRPHDMGQNLDQIVDGLARRFGWTQPSSDQDQPPPSYPQPNVS